MKNTHNSFYSENELKNLGFKSIGKNVLLSRFARIYGIEHISIGNNVRIDDFVILSGNISIGSFVHISANAILYGAAGIICQDFVNISASAKIYSQNDDYSGESLAGALIDKRYKNLQSAELTLKKYSMLGANSILLPLSNGLSEGVAVGAMSLITRPTKAWGIYAGIPARRMSERSKNILQLTKQFILETHNSMGGGA